MCKILTPGEQTSKNQQILPYKVGGCNVFSCNLTDGIQFGCRLWWTQVWKALLVLLLIGLHINCTGLTQVLNLYWFIFQTK